MTFNFSQYRRAVAAGDCEPPGVFAPFIDISRTKYDALRKKSAQIKLEPIRQRLGTETFDRVRGSLGLTLRHARGYFPAYRFLANEFLNDEWLAMVDWHKYHRDHLIHQPLSAYVGMNLLRNSQIFGGDASTSDFRGNTLLDLCIDALFTSRKCHYLMDYLLEMGAPDIYFKDFALSKRLWEWMFLDTFFLAVLFHDIGYPWRFVNLIHDKLRPHSPIDNPLALTIDGIMDGYGERLVFYPLSGYRKPNPTEPVDWSRMLRGLVSDGLALTHGVPGAIALLHLNDIIRASPLGDSDSPVRRFCIEWAAMAVMMHDMAKIYADVENGAVKPKNPQLRVSLANDPLSFVLTLTDQIQDFARPDAVFRNSRTHEVEATYKSRCESVSLDWEEGQRLLRIIYEYRNPGDYVLNRDEFLPENQLLYFHPINGYLEYTNIGINRIELDAKLA